MTAMKNSIPSQSTRCAGFTLVELLTVITIIIILAGLTVGAFGWVNKKAARSKAETQMRLLENAIQQYHADAGSYPEAQGRGNNQGGLDSLLIYRMAFGDGVGKDGVVGTSDDGRVDGKPDEGANIYLSELDPNAGNTGGWFDRTPVPTRLYDPWGNAWYYRSGNARNINPDFDLWSSGPDRQSRGDGSTSAGSTNRDNIVNW